jgi:hypothetical protein
MKITKFNKFFIFVYIYTTWSVSPCDEAHKFIKFMVLSSSHQQLNNNRPSETKQIVIIEALHGDAIFIFSTLEVV